MWLVFARNVQSSVCATDCESRSRRPVVRFHCLARDSATQDVPSTKLATQRQRSVVRLPASTGHRGVDCVGRLEHWRDHAAELWIGRGHVQARLTEVVLTFFSFDLVTCDKAEVMQLVLLVCCQSLTLSFCLSVLLSFCLSVCLCAPLLLK